jgi:xylan 1,4-beta-xylosidase
MLDKGVRPFVELGFNPFDPLHDGWHGQFWWRSNTSPPKNYDQWADLVEHFTRHCIARYGVDEVRQWYFEVWNEPNLDGFFHGGSQQQYFELYKITALTLKKVDPQLRVGGPATSNFRVRLPKGTTHVTVNHEPTPDDVEALDWRPVWVPDFLAYCHSNNLPVDFISTHPYPQSFALDDLRTGESLRIKRSVDATKHDLTRLRALVNASPYPNAKIHMTEWNSSPSSRDFTHDCLPAAAFIVKENIESAGLVDSLSYWTFTDVFEEQGAGNTIFHGGFGMVNYQGIVKPAFHAYRFLNALGDETIFKTNGIIVTRHYDTGKLTALIYQYPSEVKMSLPVSPTLKDAEAMIDRGSPISIGLKLTGLPPGANVLVETLDRSHGNAVAAWEAMKSPEPPTREQAAQLREAAMATQKETFQADGNGTFLFRREVPPWNVVLITQE